MAAVSREKRILLTPITHRLIVEFACLPVKLGNAVQTSVMDVAAQLIAHHVLAEDLQNLQRVELSHYQQLLMVHPLQNHVPLGVRATSEATATMDPGLSRILVHRLLFQI